MKTFALAILAQALVPVNSDISTSQRVEILASSAAGTFYTFNDLFADAEVRAEMARIGIPLGCPLASRTIHTAVARSKLALMTHARTAVIEVIPREQIDKMVIVSFAGSAVRYNSRVNDKLEMLARDEYQQIHQRAIDGFTEQSMDLPNWIATDADEPLLPQVVINATGAQQTDTFINSGLLTMACLMRAFPTDTSLTISSGGATWPNQSEAEQPQTSQEKGD